MYPTLLIPYNQVSKELQQQQKGIHIWAQTVKVMRSIRRPGKAKGYSKNIVVIDSFIRESSF